MKEKKTHVGVTMADVARLANVHISTVSRALKHDPRITKTVQEKVREAADSLGYRPNPLISALSTLRHQHAQLTTPTVLAYVQHQRDYITDHFNGVTKVADLNGYKVEIFTINQDMSEKRLNQILINRNIRGLILAPLPEAHGSFNLDWEHFASVSLEYSFTEPLLDRVVPDSFHSVIRAMEQCVAMGHTRIGLVLTRRVHEKNEGLLTAAYTYFVSLHPELAHIPTLLTRRTDNEEPIDAWIKKEKPQVIISSNHLLPSIEARLANMDIETPENVGLVNLNANVNDPRMSKYSGISINAEFMGNQAVVHLIHKLNNNLFGVPPARITIQTDNEWVDGHTLIAASQMELPAAFRKRKRTTGA
ncbi:LacI family DNA-binding transcriptional regulator [Ruficoccus sp. ZRK36]|uniref:LacI family DNA-binding transcriptional regulator n=1 Tax=Ruficoccus sp. ZRK36 TaxID=2866311 RepID=UPI001C72FF4A|nr:LacI family DNA-binding transcriptional regulator [Ruficoccus sp. ZRK36]QYY34384.1 LacI family transcriptional regulator [Ruficoccus sp. ZRK36]